MISDDTGARGSDGALAACQASEATGSVEVLCIQVDLLKTDAGVISDQTSQDVTTVQSMDRVQRPTQDAAPNAHQVGAQSVEHCKPANAPVHACCLGIP